jgi:hypothetical protein
MVFAGGKPRQVLQSRLGDTMNINIFPPENSLKNIIANVLLLSDKGLSVVEVKKSIKASYGVSATYQGINKILNHLKDENIVKKEDDKWLVRKEWIESVIDALSQYANKERTPLYTRSMASISFPNIEKAMDFIITNVENDRLRNNGPKVFITHVKNIGFFRPEKAQLNFLRTLAKSTEVHILMEGTNFINKLVGRYLKSFGFNIYYGIPRTTPYTISIYGNTLYHTYSGPELTEYLSKRYTKIKKVTDKEAIDLFTSLKEDKRFGIKFTFETDREIVEMTRSFLMGLAKNHM